MANRIDTKTGRQALAPRPAPYYQRTEEGVFVGVRVLPDRTQSWLVRIRVDGKQTYHRLDLRSVEEQDRFSIARDKAATLARTVLGGAPADAGTVKNAAERYLEHIKVKKGTKAYDAMRRLFENHLMSHPFAAKLVAEVRHADFAAWQASLVKVRPGTDDEDDSEAERRARSTANRIFSPVKAALTHAAQMFTLDDRGWRFVVCFPKTDKRRTLMLTDAQVATLVKAAAPDLRALIRGLVMTGCRVGELARVTVGDYDAHNGVLHIRESKTGPRSIKIPANAVPLFKEQTKNKTTGAPLFSRTDGSGWRDANLWGPVFRDLGAQTNMPEGFVAYSLRHYAISMMLANGINVTAVARLVGTSLSQIDLHYAHIADKATEMQFKRLRAV